MSSRLWRPRLASMRWPTIAPMSSRGVGGLRGRMGHVLLEGVGDVRMLGVGVEWAEEGGDLLIRLPADGTQQGRRRDLALAGDLDPQLVLVVRLELEPGAPVRDDLG